MRIFLTLNQTYMVMILKQPNSPISCTVWHSSTCDYWNLFAQARKPPVENYNFWNSFSSPRLMMTTLIALDGSPDFFLARLPHTVHCFHPSQNPRTCMVRQIIVTFETAAYVQKWLKNGPVHAKPYVRWLLGSNESDFTAITIRWQRRNGCLTDAHKL